MRKTWLPSAILLAGALLATTAKAQTDASASVLGAFSTSTNGNNVNQSPSVALGGLLELRHIAHPLVGFEATYSYYRANEVYSATSYVCPVTTPSCAPPQPQPVHANANEFTVDWVASVRILNLRPFALAGVGGVFTNPDSNQEFTNSDTKFVTVYGAGVDVALIPHFGLRLQYRGNLHKAAALSTVYTSSDAFVHTAQPMAGLYFRL